MFIDAHALHIVEEGQDVLPTAEKPFVVVTKAGQPVKLIAHEPWAGEQPSPDVKTAAVFIMPEEDIDNGTLLEEARLALEDAPDAEGVVLVGSGGEIRKVLPTADVELDESSEESRGRNEAGHTTLPGPPPRVSVSLIFTCPNPDCHSPNVSIFQKGQEVPPCPIHNIPRVRKQTQEQG